jgi:signal transduction histidine kinase
MPSRTNPLSNWLKPPGGVRLRLTAIFALLFGATLIAFSILLYRVFTLSQQREFDAALFNHAIDVSQSIEVDLFGDLSMHPDILGVTGKVFPFSIGQAFVQVRNKNGTILARSKTLGRGQLPLTADDIRLLPQGGVSFRTLAASQLTQDSAKDGSHDRPSYRLLTYAVDRPELPRLILQIAAPMTFIEKERSELLLFFTLTIPLILVIATLGGLYFSKHAFAPVKAITEKAQVIGASDLSERVPVPEAQDELRQLALTLNGLLNRLQQAFESQERFIADASHQLKTPLSILRGELDVLRSRARTAEEISTFTESASQEISFLSRMVEDLLLLARVDAGMGSLAISSVRMDEICLESVSRLAKLAESRGIRIKLNLADAPASQDAEPGPFTVRGDMGLLQCMLQNLIENAIKYSPDGGTIGMDLEGYREYVVVSVRDHGPGIPPEALPRVFDRFFRGSATREKISGVGLGLAISRRIAEVHGGTLEAESRPGMGSVFTARIKKL